MSEHTARIDWQLTEGEFLKGRYSREHTWSFDGGVTVPASPSPSVVPAPYSNASSVDPEEAFVASIASCHMLTFLFLASREGFEVSSYQDNAVGVMTRHDNGVPWISSVVLRPSITYGGEKQPGPDDEARLHHRAHAECFISNSVKTEISVRQPTSAT